MSIPRPLLLAAALAASACRSTPPETAPEPAPAPATPAPGTPAPATPAPATPAPAPAPNASAIRFMQRMIDHHGQAITMAALAQQRSENDALRLLAERITVSQRDEIASMQRWLRAHGQPAPEPSEHAGHGGDAMPGMATQVELEGLATSSGRRFDRRFVELMIRHHEGALAMVAEVLRAPGATQDPTVFTLASDIDADQRAEIARLRTLRAQLDAS